MSVPCPAFVRVLTSRFLFLRFLPSLPRLTLTSSSSLPAAGGEWGWLTDKRQQSQLSQSERMMYNVSWNLITCWITLKVTQGHPNCCYLIGHISLPAIGLKELWLYLAHFRDTITFTVWLQVTLKSPLFLKRQLILQATHAFQFMMCKHITDNIHIISRGFKQQKWYLMSFTLIGNGAIRQAHTISY